MLIETGAVTPTRPTIRVGLVRASAAALLVTAAVLVPLGLSSPAVAVPSSCTPESGFDTCLRFAGTGDDQLWVVPAGVTSIKAKLWGAGGGPVEGADGGGGGFTVGTVAVVPSAFVTVTVGEGSINGAATYGGGGAADSAGARGGGGGGMSALWNGDTYGTSPFLIAGGGGGAAVVDQAGLRVIGSGGGGGGGGTTGGKGPNDKDGSGGTASAGGAHGPQGYCSVAPTDGAAYSGGRGSAANWTLYGGAGGGGGAYGGGGGSCQDDIPLARALPYGTYGGSGGGGSGLANGTGTTNGTTTEATSSAAAGAGDTHYQTGVGDGSGDGDGAIVVQYNAQTSQTITFGTLGLKHVADSPVTLTATASSSLAVTYTSDTTSVCTVTGTSVTLLTIGTCTIIASQAGNSTYAAAAPQSRSFAVVPPAPAPGPETTSGFGTAPQSVTIEGSVTLLDASVPVLTLTVPEEGTYTVSGSVITFTPVLGFVGTATSVGFQVTDDYDQTGDSTYTPTVTTPAAPVAVLKTSDGVGTAVQSVTIVRPTGGTWTLLDAADAPATTVTVADQGTYAMDTEPDVITFTPVLGFAGIATPVTYRVTDAYDQDNQNTYTPTVTAPAGPVTEAMTSTGAGTAAQTATIEVPTGGSVTMRDINFEPVLTLTIPLQGTYTISGNVITFTPVLGFTGVATAVSFRVVDAYGTPDNNTYTTTVTLPAGPVAELKTSSGVGTESQTATIVVPAQGSVTLLDSNDDPVTTLTVLNEGTYVLSGNIITFTPIDGYSGTSTPVSYQVFDAYEQSDIGAYRATVIPPAGPVAVAQVSTGIGTAAQSVTIEGTVTLLDASSIPATTVTVANQGTYVLSGNVVTFTPVLGFSGVATAVTFRLTDAYGSTADNTYTPTVTKPTGPAAAALTSTGITPAAQSVTITIPALGTMTLVEDGEDVTTVIVPNQGTYALDDETGELTFTPLVGYTGAANYVTYRLTDAYAQVSSSTYTATVTAAAPVTTPQISTGIGRAAQTATLEVPDGSVVTLTGPDDTQVSALTVADEGTYVVSGNIITFTPALGFLGTATPVEYRVTATDTQYGTSTYTPTVTVPADPTADNKTSTGVGTETQSVTVEVPEGGSVTLIDSDLDAVDSVVIPDEGVYELDTETGTITFSPELGFLGEATPVTYRITDAYDQTADATYTPTVTIPPPPAAPDESSTGRGTTPQSAELAIPLGGGISLLDSDDDPASQVVVDEGTYSLDITDTATFRAAAMRAPAPATATVTFRPVLGFLGQAPPVGYQITDAYEQTASALYTPTVIRPFAPVARPMSTTAPEGDSQRVTIAVPAGGDITLLDADGDPVLSVTFAGQGTYVLDPDTGTIAFIAVQGFVGTPDAVAYRITDAYDQSADSSYTARVTGLADATPDPDQDGTLPVTGGTLLPIMLFALLIIVAGAGLRLVARQPRRRLSGGDE